jgi:hypothetical protein
MQHVGSQFHSLLQRVNKDYIRTGMLIQPRRCNELHDLQDKC